MHPLYRKAVVLEGIVRDAAKRVHRYFGPGLLESVYRRCLAYELRRHGHRAEEEKRIVFRYGDLEFEDLLRADIVVDDCFIIELKSHAGHIALEERMQLLTYLKAANLPLGSVINFGVANLEGSGIRSVILAGANNEEVPSGGAVPSVPNMPGRTV